ncbi:hypothetical protein ALP73_03137 [Pseudomonas coronafaciens pv. garcae]|uniref:Uncharacterized protein n=2 Tax=Pseudomonas syringae group TaxID=136849 RepID=A0AB37QIN9_9PSED|nr:MULTISPECIES: hypothetical protein [Pseudomonas syringae group]RMR96340.1 hypothetical protein ALP74_02667 [Pseudomonas coronafaciens pv. garcae]RMS05117.1 hypothetical protein ALP73_03137 [Pseudomonas coronafaciens pv. garcae]RMS36697.1 hypothetical protein ALP71_02775 [Pseudomonas coronafaciens pv. garcae]RMV05029.1 hypothetical protein ALP20_01713 [Pseudomonas coronafaciens pv. coronafaciens]
MSNHTKEQWLVDRQDYCIGVERDGEPLEIATITAMDHNGIKHFIGDQSWANAYLMRTAPELLKALEAILAKAYKQNWNDHSPELLEQAKKVIALAKAGSALGDGGESEYMEL